MRKGCKSILLPVIVLLAALLATVQVEAGNLNENTIPGQPDIDALKPTSAPDVTPPASGVNLIVLLDDGMTIRNTDAGLRREMLRWYLSALCTGENSRVATVTFQHTITNKAVQWLPLTTATEHRTWMSVPIEHKKGYERSHISQGITGGLALVQEFLGDGLGANGTKDVLYLAANYKDELSQWMKEAGIVETADTRLAMITISDENLDEAQLAQAQADIATLAEVLLVIFTQGKDDDLLRALEELRLQVEGLLSGTHVVRRELFAYDEETKMWGLDINLSDSSLRGVDLISDMLPKAMDNDKKITLQSPLSEEDEEAKSPIQLSEHPDVMSYQSDRILIHWPQQAQGTGIWRLSLGTLTTPAEGLGADIVFHYSPVEIVVERLSYDSIRWGDSLEVSAKVNPQGRPTNPKNLPGGLELLVDVIDANGLSAITMDAQSDGETWKALIPSTHWRAGIGSEDNTLRLIARVPGSETPLGQAEQSITVVNQPPVAVLGVTAERIVWEVVAPDVQETPQTFPYALTFPENEADSGTVEASKAFSWQVGALFSDDDSDIGDVLTFVRATIRRLDYTGGTYSETHENFTPQGTSTLLRFQSLKREDACYEIDVVACDLRGAEATTTLRVVVEDRGTDLSALRYSLSLADNNGVASSLSQEVLTYSKRDIVALVVKQAGGDVRLTTEQMAAVLANANLLVTITSTPDGHVWAQGEVEAEWIVEVTGEKRFVLPIPDVEGMYTYTFTLENELGYSMQWEDGRRIFRFTLQVDNERPVLTNVWPGGWDENRRAVPLSITAEVAPFMGISLYSSESLSLRPDRYFFDADDDELRYYLTSAEPGQTPFVIDVNEDAGVILLHGCETGEEGNQSVATEIDGGRTWTIVTNDLRDFSVALFSSDNKEVIHSVMLDDVDYGVVRVEGKSTVQKILRTALLTAALVVFAFICLCILRQAIKPAFGSKQADILHIVVEQPGREPIHPYMYAVPLAPYRKRSVTLEVLLHCLPLTGVYIDPENAKKVVFRPTRKGVMVKSSTDWASVENRPLRNKEEAVLTQWGGIRVNGVNGKLVIRLKEGISSQKQRAF